MSKESTENIKLAFFLSVIFTIIEMVGGVLTNSAAIISNGVHDLGDSFSLGFSWFLEGKAQKDSDHKYAYGYKRYSILGAFVSFISILFGAVIVLYESIPRLFHPEQVHVEGMVWLALIGLLVNGWAYLKVRKGTTLNEHTTSLQVKEDVLSWTGILIIAILVYFNPSFEILDPILSLLLITHSLVHIFKSLKIGFRVLLQGKPFDLNEQNLKDKILNLKEVVEVYDLKTWTLDGEYNIITMKVILKSMTLEESEKSKKKIRLILDDFNLHHSTIELEFKKKIMKNFKISEAVKYGFKTTIANFWILFFMVILLFGMGWSNNIFEGSDLFWSYSGVLIILSIFFTAFLLKVVLNIYDNKKDKFEEVSEIFPKLLRFILAYIIYQVIVLVGLVFFIVPGVIMIIKYQFTPYLIIDKDLSLGDAFKKSNELASGVQWKLFLFIIAGILVSISGFLVFGIGLFVSIPTVWLAGVFVYRSLLEQSKIK